ncbi:MAG: alpha/beta fold hydrolase [Pseudomonadota bacterium]|nr:alpha/beta fold hydrolase [Pseudomonadota bacterium]
MSNTPDPWIPFRQPRPRARLRLFCLPYAGGGAYAYRTWAGGLAEHIEVCPVQLPGRENRLGEPAYARLDPLAAALSQALLPYLDRPFALFGHSMGSIIAYELAQRLRAGHGLQPVHLLVSARRAPQLPYLDPPCHPLPDPEFKARLREYNGTPAAVLDHPELMGLLLPLLRRDFELNETYVPSTLAPLDCPVTAFGGEADATVSLAHLDAWRQITRGPFRRRLLPGDHFYLQQHAPRLWQAIAEVL